MKYSALQIKVFGHVQGVYFRASTQEKAQALRLKGTVQNLPDRSVLKQVYGPDEQINSLTKWLYIGPPLARVDRLEITPIEYVELPDFKIIR
ncbi:MAG: acylphosphatase [Bacteroidota bacterium]